MERLLGQLQQENPAVTAAVYENFTASLRLNTVKEEEPLQQAENLLRQIADFAQKENYHPCCSGCGKTKDVRRFLLDGDARMLCPACRAKAEAGLTDQWQRKKFQHHSALKGFIVVLVILLIGATAWVGVYTSGHSDWRGNDSLKLLGVPAYGRTYEKRQRDWHTAGTFGHCVFLP